MRVQMCVLLTDVVCTARTIDIKMYAHGVELVVSCIVSLTNIERNLCSVTPLEDEMI